MKTDQELPVDDYLPRLSTCRVLPFDSCLWRPIFLYNKHIINIKNKQNKNPNPHYEKILYIAKKPQNYIKVKDWLLTFLACVSGFACPLSQVESLE